MNETLISETYLKEYFQHVISRSKFNCYFSYYINIINDQQSTAFTIEKY